MASYEYSPPSLIEWWPRFRLSVSRSCVRWLPATGPAMALVSEKYPLTLICGSDFGPWVR
jgi:hypothetical protein